MGGETENKQTTCGWGDGRGSGYGDRNGEGDGEGRRDWNAAKTEIMIIDQNLDCLPLLLGAIMTEEGQQYLEKILRQGE